ncbi:MAG: DNA repair exonuclease [Trueperaceae bacterium]|nr:DNA repair exonuclease [Trueperaceae bacterium]
MPRLLHLADLHLGWTPRGLPDDRARVRRERRDALLDQAVELALSEAVDAVLIAGDLFERHRPGEATVARALAALRRLSDAGIAVVTVPGNHDELSYADAVYRTEADNWPGVLVDRPTFGPVATLRLGGREVHVAGLAYVGGVTPASTPLADFPRADGDDLHVAILHGTLVRPGARGAFAGERSLPIDAVALAAAGFDYVALGHLHVPQRHAGRRGPAVYPGCVGGKGLDDVGARHWTLVDLEPGAARVREVPARVQPLAVLEVDVGAFDDAPALLAHVRDRGDGDALVRVRLVGAVAFDLDAAALEARAADAFFHLEVEDATTSVASALLDAWAARPTVLGAFVRRLRAQLDAAADDAERARLTRALRYGVHALEGDR